MKKIYLIILSLLLNTMVWAQTPILSEGFESQQFPPSGWSRESILMSMYTWFRGGPLYTYDWWNNQYHVVPPEGVRMAALECDLTDEWGPQDESLITPMITIEQPSVLTFETFCQYGHPEYQDHYKVDVLDANGAWNTLWDGAEQPTAWLNQFEEPVSIDLSAYQGQSIKLRFRGHNNGNDVLTYPWFIDNVKVMPIDTIPNSVDETAFQVNIYPNPVHQIMNIQSSSLIQQVCIYNILGVKVKEMTVNAKEAMIDLSGCPSGVYAVEVMDENHRKIVRTIYC
jgi:hypothetical protein